MKALRDWLKDGDPVAHEPPLSDADVQRMRHAISAAGQSQPPIADWARGSWATATVVVALTVAVSMTRWFTPLPEVRRDEHASAAPQSEPLQPAGRRQVQLIAPGGTRVIWIFNDNFRP
jgi:hypothetical protein